MHGVAAESKKNTIPTRTTTPAGQVLNASLDPEVDIITPDSNGPEDDGAATQTARDPQSEVIKHLEKKLPTLPGFSEEGSMDEVKPVSCWGWNLHLLFQSLIIRREIQVERNRNRR